MSELGTLKAHRFRSHPQLSLLLSLYLSLSLSLSFSLSLSLSFSLSLSLFLSFSLFLFLSLSLSPPLPLPLPLPCVRQVRSHLFLLSLALCRSSLPCDLPLLAPPPPPTLSPLVSLSPPLAFFAGVIPSPPRSDREAEICEIPEIAPPWSSLCSDLNDGELLATPPGAKCGPDDTFRGNGCDGGACCAPSLS